MDEQEIGREYLAAAAKMLEKCQAVSPQTRAKRQSGLIRKEAKKENIILLFFNIFHSEPRNCKVSVWGPWSDCNKSCGIGEKLRFHHISLKKTENFCYFN